MNSISDRVSVGCAGELLVQIRLLQYGVQAAPPLKDSGNDLIAVTGTEFRAVSVRTTRTGIYTKPALRSYHVLAVVHMLGDDTQLHLDASDVYLVPRDDVGVASTRCSSLRAYILSKELVHRLFGLPPEA